MKSNSTSSGITRLTFGLLALAMSGAAAQAGSLFGDHSCLRWLGLEYVEKRTWTNAFMAPLSLTMKGLHKSPVDPYNDDPKAHQPAIRYIDAFCLSHPGVGASEAAGRYLKKLFDLPGH
jgi:hypothetical protein